MTASEILGSFTASITLDRVPATLIAKAKEHLIDTIGVTCAGLTVPQAQLPGRDGSP